MDGKSPLAERAWWRSLVLGLVLAFVASPVLAYFGGDIGEAIGRYLYRLDPDRPRGGGPAVGHDFGWVILGRVLGTAAGGMLPWLLFLGWRLRPDLARLTGRPVQNEEDHDAAR